MKRKLRTFRTATSLDYPDDCETIRAALASVGISVTLLEAQQLWRDFSEEYYAAGWLMLDGYTGQQLVDILTEPCG